MIADWLEGKKTILTGVLIAILSALPLLGVRLPEFLQGASEAAIMTALGVLVVIFRLVARPKP